MKRVIILMAVVGMLPASMVYAKRAAPREVSHVVSGEVEYRAPRDHIGCVEAWDKARGKMMWRRQIYVVRYDLNLERDVQDVFVKTMELKGNVLVIRNERQSEYQLDLKSLDVRVVKGPLVEEKSLK